MSGFRQPGGAVSDEIAANKTNVAEAKHTPTPEEFALGLFASSDRDQFGLAVRLFRIAQEQAAARAINRALGAFDALVKALERAADVINDMDGGDPGEETGWRSDEALDVWLQARAALALARGEQP